VRADLVQVEQAGYRPGAGTDVYYPADIQAAEQHVAAKQGVIAADVGGAAGAAESGAPARPMNVDGVHPLYFGR
jgi:hypothetical protein